VDLARSSGIPIFPEQELAIDAILSEDGSGRWSALEAAVVVSRQNGKTMNIILPVVLADLFLFGAELIVWTAHLFRTTQESFRALQQVIAGSEHLSRRVKKISGANGEEGVELHGGARVNFLARSKTGGRGLTGDRVVLDEAFAVDPSHMGSLLPTLSARPNPQVLYGSSAGLLGSAMLRSIRNRGRAGGDPSLVYCEWCSARRDCATANCTHSLDAVGCQLDDRSNWYAANFGMGHGLISENFVAAERRALPPEEFARERMGWWEDPAEDVGEFLTAWSACADARSTAEGRPVFAVDVAPGSTSAAIVAGTRRPDGLPHLELVEHRRRVDWLIRRCGELAERNDPLGWVLDPSSPAGALLPDLAKAGIEPQQMNARDMGQGCEALTSTAKAGGLRHLGDPVVTGAILGASRRDIGDGLWAWSRRKSGTDICPLVAATEAHWLLSTLSVALPAIY
jgi:hypothetical protein